MGTMQILTIGLFPIQRRAGVRRKRRKDDRTASRGVLWRGRSVIDRAQEGVRHIIQVELVPQREPLPDALGRICQFKADAECCWDDLH